MNALFLRAEAVSEALTCPAGRRRQPPCRRSMSFTGFAMTATFRFVRFRVFRFFGALVRFVASAVVAAGAIGIFAFRI